MRAAGAMPHDAAAVDTLVSGGTGVNPPLQQPSRRHNPQDKAAAMQAVDRMVALVALVFTLPLLLLCALAIRLSSPGPVLLCTRCVGRDGRGFPLWMFRTTRTGAAPGSAEVTLVGELLQQTRIDQFPVLLSVVRGDMALVGPAPEPFPWLVSSRDDERQRAPATPKPGLSGWLEMP